MNNVYESAFIELPLLGRIESKDEDDGILQIFVGHIFGQAQIPVPVILQLGADIDQVMSRICIDIIGFPLPVFLVGSWPVERE